MMDHNKTPEKPKSDLARIPSPGSVSSVHSIRPLEWDSGADIGYQNTSHTDLSTVERMALVNGTASLYKTSETAGSFTDRRDIGNPLAESSPFVRVSNTDAAKPLLPENKPLVDYSISDHSIDHGSIQELLDAELTRPDKGLSESSRSLEDLRHVRRVRSLNGYSKSRSSQNVSSGEKHYKRYASSSSVATVIPQELHRRVSNKSIQVDENSILELLKKSEFFQSKDDDYSTYTVDCKPFDSEIRSRLSDRESNSESVDGGSFEYVPGSQYNSNRHVASTLSSSSSGINTLCPEVIDGVDLITKYVNNLNVSNKNKVIRKVAQSLMNQLPAESVKTREGSDNSLKFEANLPSTPHQFAVRVDSPSLLVVNSDMVFEPIEKPNQYPNELEKSSTTSKFESTSVDDAKSSESLSSDRMHISKRHSGGRIKSRILESSDFSKSSTSVKTIPTANGSNSYAASCTENSSKSSSNVYSLKKYLAKEREAQLLWIKSGIDHLNNLKKLYESQKVLKKDLALYKKKVSKETSTTTSEIESQTRRPLESSKLSRTAKSIQKSIQTSTSDLNDDSRNCGTARLQPTNRNTISSRKLVVKKYCKKVQQNENSCQCRTCNCCGKNIQNSENKENIEHTDRKKSTGTPIRSAKKPISYTVLFDKTPCHDKKYRVKQQTVKKSFCKTIYFAAKSPSASSELRFKPLDADQCPSLQEYLLKNKPEYVDRAEFRRQCLSEIAQLRELRDKSKSELMPLISRSDESGINTIRQHLPPAPLSVMRIFSDRTLRKQTLKKYQQLPEVQMRKLEQKRRENNRRNQIMAKVFTRKLQRKVLKGQVNLGNSVSVISN